MEATELRIGNNVLRHGVVVNVDARSIFDIWDNSGINILGYKPIPLTEEWLDKLGFLRKPIEMWKGNGFDYQPNYPRTYQLDYVMHDFIFRFEEFHYVSKKKVEIDRQRYIVIGDWYPRICESNIYPSVDYVHQLQNLFYSLTGTELSLAKNKTETNNANETES
jgi:hypothetical protein